MGNTRCRGTSVVSEAPRRESLKSGATYLVRDPVDSNGEVALFVHGLGSTAAAWQPVVRHAPDHVGLLIPDLPGFGKSPSGRAAPLEAATDMLVELLQRHLGRTHVTVVAHSVGAIVAMHALQKVEGSRLRRLILVAGTLLSATRVFAAPRAAAAEPALTAMVGIHMLAGVIPLDARLARVIAQHRSLRVALLWPFLADPPRVPERELLAVLPHRGGRESLRAIWSARQVDVRALMVDTKVATRIVHGVDDRLVDDGDVNAACSLLDPDEVVALEGCGHWPHIERPAQTAAAAFAL